MSKSSSMYHLFWGVTLFSLYTVLMAKVATLMRLSPPLLPSQTYALIFVGEICSFAPFIPAAIRRWSINKKAEWISFLLFSSAMACSFIWGIYCTQRMPLGEFCRYLYSNYSNACLTFRASEEFLSQ